MTRTFFYSYWFVLTSGSRQMKIELQTSPRREKKTTTVSPPKCRIRSFRGEIVHDERHNQHGQRSAENGHENEEEMSGWKKRTRCHGDQRCRSTRWMKCFGDLHEKNGQGHRHSTGDGHFESSDCDANCTTADCTNQMPPDEMSRLSQRRTWCTEDQHGRCSE